MNKKRKIKKLPKFKNITEEMHFWDEHVEDALDYFNLDSVVKPEDVHEFSLSIDLKESLVKIANMYNMSIEELLKMWIGNYVSENETENIYKAD